jgi:methylated-DNA-protein-cysteine methyltransferase-like protein
MSKFKEAVIKVVKMIPHGNVVSYGQVALYVGAPRAAREVGWMLNQTNDRDLIPWWRVINNEGRISIKGSRYSANEQRELLIQEGIKVDEDFTLDIDKYRFVPDKNFVKKLELDPLYSEKILIKIPLSKPYFGRRNVA